jgi:hypothetical protein
VEQAENPLKVLGQRFVVDDEKHVRRHLRLDLDEVLEGEVVLRLKSFDHFPGVIVERIHKQGFRVPYQFDVRIAADGQFAYRFV